MKALLLFLLTTGALAETRFIERDDFLATMRGGIPQLFCNEDQYFKKCFKVSREECLKEADRDITVCSKSMEIPEKLAHPDEGRAMSVKLGECAGAEYARAMAPRKIKTCVKPNP